MASSSGCPSDPSPCCPLKKGMEESEEEDATTAKAETKTEKKDDEE